MVCGDTCPMYDKVRNAQILHLLFQRLASIWRTNCPNAIYWTEHSSQHFLIMMGEILNYWPKYFFVHDFIQIYLFLSFTTLVFPGNCSCNLILNFQKKGLHSGFCFLKNKCFLTLVAICKIPNIALYLSLTLFVAVGLIML